VRGDFVRQANLTQFVAARGGMAFTSVLVSGHDLDWAS
jgi:hypothetical protein